jgi:hypothetical protein
VLDQADDSGGVQMVRNHVTQHVKLGIPQRGEAGVRRGHEIPPGQPRGGTEEALRNEPVEVRR